MLVVYLAAAILGMFTFAVIEPLRDVDFSMDEPISGGFFAPLEHAVDCLAEGSTTISRGRGHAFSPWHNGQMRIVMPGDARSAGIIALFLILKAAGQITYLQIKNTIPLKLRI